MTDRIDDQRNACMLTSTPEFHASRGISVALRGIFRYFCCSLLQDYN